MTIGRDLILTLRESWLDDTEPPYNWKDQELLRFLNYAEVQACRRANLIIDTVTANDCGTSSTAGTASTAGQKPLCTVTIIANTALYNLSPKILQVKRVQLASMTYPLVGPMTYDDLDDLASGWRGTGGLVGSAGSGGVPFGFLNEPSNTITFIQAPSTNDTAYLVVSRLPLVQITLDTHPEIDEQYHVDLLDWAAHLAFSKPDSEVYSPQLAKEYEDRFTLKFGPLPDARSQKMFKNLQRYPKMRARSANTFGI